MRRRPGPARCHPSGSGDLPGGHPTYAALGELGKVIKTIFLCRYIGSEALRREIHAGLNVVENWNGAHSFIFFGKGGEVASNRLETRSSRCWRCICCRTAWYT